MAGFGACDGDGAGQREYLLHTNIVLTELADNQVHARSKGIGIRADGTCGSVTYEDTIVRGEHDWRINRRKIIPHRVPLGGK